MNPIGPSGAHPVAVLIAILVANLGLVAFSSLFAITGSGDDRFVIGVIQYGFAWTLTLFAVSIALYLKGNPATAITLAAVTCPLGFLAAALFFVGDYQVQQHRESDPEFVLNCQTAGTKYYSQPAERVHSLAYDWREDAYPPDYNHFNVDEKGNLSELGGGTGKFPTWLDFTEERCCRFRGRRLEKSTPYLRIDPDQETLQSGLTADALAFFETRTFKTGSGIYLEQVDIAVSDRRDGAKLATLRYFLDRTNNRACGETSPGVMDERSFLLNATSIKSDARRSPP